MKSSHSLGEALVLLLLFWEDYFTTPYGRSYLPSTETSLWWSLRPSSGTATSIQAMNHHHCLPHLMGEDIGVMLAVPTFILCPS